MPRFGNGLPNYGIVPADRYTAGSHVGRADFFRTQKPRHSTKNAYLCNLTEVAAPGKCHRQYNENKHTMADNYLEKRYEEVFGTGRTKLKRVGHTLDELLLRNRSQRGYLKDYVVKREELERIVAVCSKVPSARNQQVLRFRLVTRDTGADKVLENIRLGAALPELHLPLPGTEPEAFIIVCSTVAETKMVDIDLGIALQSMLLKAVEMGLNGLAIGAFNKAELIHSLNLPLEPLMVVAIGKGIEKIELKPIAPDESHAYYRQGGIHYVPKVGLKDLMI